MALEKSLYQYIKENEEKIKELTALGVVEFHVNGHVNVYEEFLKTEEMEETNKARYEVVANITKYKPDTVRHIVHKMRKPVQL